MALIDEPTGYDVRVARAIYAALTDDREDQRLWHELPEHRRWRYIRAAIAAIDAYDRTGGATVIAFRERERTG